MYKAGLSIFGDTTCAQYGILKQRTSIRTRLLVNMVRGIEKLADDCKGQVGLDRPDDHFLKRPGQRWQIDSFFGGSP